MGVRLNKAQRAAVNHTSGPLLVLAGAGSGKTGVVTRRIARLIEAGVPGRAILAMTFTNKAAAEMQERVVRLVGKRASKGLLLCTFHRFGLEVLGKETAALGLRGGRFAIFDRGDCLGVLRDVMQNVSADRNPDLGAILNRISLAKNAFQDAAGYELAVAESDDPYDELTAIAFPRYESALRSLQAFDFDDLVCEPVHLWRRRPEVLARWRERFNYLIVDEYQDTNQSQLEMLRLLAETHRNLCVVGDDNQAIYAWRGADVRNILDFTKHFPGAMTVALEHNYRSKAAVLEVANAVLEASSARRHEKRLIPTQGEGSPVKTVVTPDGSLEARFVAEEIGRLMRKGISPRECAILYRSNLQAGELESELKGRGVPYQLFGGTQTFERKEVKDVLAYLHVAIAPDSELPVRRSINYPARGIGEVGISKLAGHATTHGLSLMAAIERMHAINGLSPAARDGCRRYAQIITEVRRSIDQGQPAGEVIRELVKRIDLKAAIWAESGDNNKAAGRRWANIQYLVRTFERRESKKRMDRQGWAHFLRVLTLREETEEGEETPDKVTLTTMHGAKGLEFRVVFVVGLEEGLLPHARTLDERVTDGPAASGVATDEIEQERRLFYVAITRAKELLYLCRADYRPARGKLVKRAASRFLLQIPEELLEKVDVMATPVATAEETGQGVKGLLAALMGSEASGGSQP